MKATIVTKNGEKLIVEDVVELSWFDANSRKKIVVTSASDFLPLVGPIQIIGSKVILISSEDVRYYEFTVD